VLVANVVDERKTLSLRSGKTNGRGNATRFVVSTSLAGNDIDVIAERWLIARLLFIYVILQPS
jgi:hypothetical protein